jgi:Histidine kinase-like ATPase domain
MNGARRAELELAPRLEEVGRAITWASQELPAWVDPVRLDVGLTEALTNAIVHGALEVSSSLRHHGVETYLGEVERRSQAPEAATKSLVLTIEHDTRQVDIALSWLGAPCPASLRGKSGPVDPLAGSGLGTTLIYASFDEVIWGADGYSLLLRMYEDARPAQSTH